MVLGPKGQGRPKLHRGEYERVVSPSHWGGTGASPINIFIIFGAIGHI